VISGRSLQKRENRVGPSTDPCGTPKVTAVSVTNVVTHNHICPLTPFDVEVTFMFMHWSAKGNRQKQHRREGGGEEY